LPLQGCPSSKTRAVVERLAASATERVSGSEVVLVVKGCPAGASRDPLHVRLHSECFTGDVLGSMRCDCNAQKDRFLALMENLDNAALVYIRGHEGRGNGLLPKLHAYAGLERDPTLHHEAALQRLGLQSDCRCYKAAIEVLLRHVNVKEVVLYSNNPQKRAAMVEALGGEHVRFESMEARSTQHNLKYLVEKQRDMGHIGLLGPCEVLLERIGIRRSGDGARASLELLRRVVAGMLEFMPFQSLSMMLGLQTDTAQAVFDSKGGVCFILNPLLCSLLRELGFDAVLVRATTEAARNRAQPDHVALVVRTVEDCEGGRSADFWVDVGNSRPYFEPLPLCHDEAIAEHPLMDYRVIATGSFTYKVQHRNPKHPEWRTNYVFSTEEAPESFATVLRQQHEAAGPFRRALRASRWFGCRGHGYILKDRVGKEVRSDGIVAEKLFACCDDFVEWMQEHFPELSLLSKPAWAAATESESTPHALHTCTTRSSENAVVFEAEGKTT